MDVLSCTVGGQTVALHLRRTAKKNIIARPRDTGSLNVSIPPRLPLAAVSQWAQTNQNALAELLRHAYPAPARPASALPEQILFGGHWHSVKPAPVSSLAHDPAARMFRLPVHLTPQAQTELLRRHLIRTARETLLPKLAAHGTRLRLVPAAAALTNAKTLWGVCRSRTGIRINWRLVGAPENVQDYVCIHELCHLAHPDHSPAFWTLVRRCCPDTDHAKAWLKRHGSTLFALG